MRETLFDLGRAAGLLRVLIRFGFALCWPRLRGQRSNWSTLAVQVRVALEELGLVYLKFGQFLATRFDLLPPAVCRELAKLFDQVPPISFQNVREVLEADLEQPLERLYAAFDQRPLASATIAQVHKARTHEGRHVAVKVQRPGIVHLFESDIRNLRRVSRVIDRLGFFGHVSLAEVIEAFALYTRREMDFLVEGQAADRLRTTTINGEVVPAIHWQRTTQRVLTMDFVEGLTLARINELLREGNRDRILAELPEFDIDLTLHNIAIAVLHQLFTVGFFHGDPHPGNVIVRRDNRVAFVDFGIFGYLSGYHRETLSQYIDSLSRGDIEESFRQLMKLVRTSENTDCNAFEREIKIVLERWYRVVSDPSVPVAERRSAKYSNNLIDAIRRYHVRMGMDTLLFWRVLTMLDLSATFLSEHFDLLAELRNFFMEGRRTELFRWLTDQVFGNKSDIAAVGLTVG
jgi:ubiquinone biosynthesis protein